MTWEDFAIRSKKERTSIWVGGIVYQVVDVLDLRKNSMVLLVYRRDKGFSVVKASLFPRKEPPSILEEGSEHFLSLIGFWNVEGLRVQSDSWEGELPCKNLTLWEYAEEVLSEKIGKASPREVLRWLIEVAEALSVIHSKGRVHLDIKPSNIFLVRGKVKLGDFDFYSPLEEINRQRKGRKIYMGTFGYMAPEFFQEGEITEKVDIYSAGVTFAQLLTGKSFPQLKGEDPLEFTLRVREFLLEALKNRRGKLPALIIRMLSLDPSARPSAKEIVRALGPREKRRPGKLPLFMGGLLLLALISSGLFFFLRRTGKEVILKDGRKAEEKVSEKKPAKKGVKKKKHEDRIFSMVKAKATRLYKNERGAWEAELPYGIKMVFVKGGEFLAGCNENYCIGEYNPPHRAKLRSFWMQKYEATFAQFDAFCDQAYCGTWQVLFYTSSRPPDFFMGRGRNPVTMVSWEDAMNFALWLSRQLGLPFRLPTQDEWEFAARERGKNTVYPGFSPVRAEDYAWFANNGMLYPRRVGLKLPNGLGIYDMAGNVLEWCMDDYSPGEKILKGGNVNSPLEGMKVYLVYHAPTSHRDITTGFRLVIGEY